MARLGHYRSCRLERKYRMRCGIVISVEGLNTGLVGAYGTNTAVTPTLDLLAARGLVLDQCFVDSLDRRQHLISLWCGRHACQPGSSSTSLWSELDTGGYDACLITDCSEAAELAEYMGCSRVLLVNVQQNAEAADDWTACGLMEVFVAAIDELESEGGLKFVWIHSRGLRHVWDAPLELRCKFVDPEDPDPPSQACCPRIEIDDTTDPDEVTGWGQVAAAQVAVVDQALEVILSTVQQRSDADDWSWLILSLGGVPLGEHGRIGWHEPRLYGEEVSCLAIFCPSLQTPVGQRRAELCQLPDLNATLVAILEIDVQRASSVWGRNLLKLDNFALPIQWDGEFQTAYIQSSTGSRWLRTPAWSGILDGETAQLFVKPDDRWEVSDVASRRPDVVDRLRELAASFERCLASEQRCQLPRLEEELCNLLR